MSSRCDDQAWETRTPPISRPSPAQPYVDFGQREKHKTANRQVEDYDAKLWVLTQGSETQTAEMSFFQIVPGLSLKESVRNLVTQEGLRTELLLHIKRTS